MKYSLILLPVAMLLPAAGPCAEAEAPAKSFYKQSPLFSTAPDAKAQLTHLARFGPVGIGLELIQPAFVMRVGDIEKGSPAEATGKLRKGQIIETINGQKLADIDPRIQLGQIITAAEAGDGVVKLMVKESPQAAAQEVVVKIPASKVRYLTDDELLALFPGTPVALGTVNGKTFLIFPRPGDEARFISRPITPQS